MEQERARAGQRVPRAAWAVPAAAVLGGLVLATVLEVRRRRRHGGGWRRSFRSPCRVDTVPDELRRIGVAPGYAVLELGCGVGAYLEEAARTVGLGGEVRGVEPDLEQAQLARRRLAAQGMEIAIEVGPLDRLPYPDGEFDLAYLVARLGTLSDREATLREAWRVLKPGGRLAITEHLADRSYVPASIVQRAGAAAGFELADSEEGSWDHTSAFRRPLTAA